MPKVVTEYSCMIISPSDVQDQREAAVDVINNWNAHIGAGQNIRIKPVRWEVDARPEMGAPGQEIINRQLVDECDFGFAIFWSKLGQPTAQHPSGSVEEIERLRQRGAKVWVYFSSESIPQSALKDDQFTRLAALRKRYESEGLFKTFDNIYQLREMLQLHLSSLISELRSQSIATAGAAVENDIVRTYESIRRAARTPDRAIIDNGPRGAIPPGATEIIKLLQGIALRDWRALRTDVAEKAIGRIDRFQNAFNEFEEIAESLGVRLRMILRRYNHNKNIESINDSADSTYCMGKIFGAADDDVLPIVNMQPEALPRFAESYKFVTSDLEFGTMVVPYIKARNALQEAVSELSKPL